MQNKRYNTFSKIHKGLRTMLCDTANRLQQTDFIEPEADTAIHQLKETLSFFSAHAAHEDRFILPPIRKYNAALVDDLENEHQIDHKLTEELNSLIHNWEATLYPEKRDVIGKRILLSFHEFVAFNLYHMNKEETTFLMVLWQHYTDEEIMQMEQDIIKSAQPEVLAIQSRWMMRSINNQEAIEWLKGIKQNAPEPVFQHFMHLANEEIPAERQRIVQEALLADV